jgi:hypothetical protein
LSAAGAGKTPTMHRFRNMTHAAVSGAKGAVAKKAERPLARRTPFSRDTIRTLFGAAFLVVSARTILRALRAGLR